MGRNRPEGIGHLPIYLRFLAAVLKLRRVPRWCLQCQAGVSNCESAATGTSAQFGTLPRESHSRHLGRGWDARIGMKKARPHAWGRASGATEADLRAILGMGLFSGRRVPSPVSSDAARRRTVSASECAVRSDTSAAASKHRWSTICILTQKAPHREMR